MTPTRIPIASVKDLQKTYRVGFLRKRVEALRKISFDVYAGEVFGIVGHNGAGKTTTIKILTGLMKASGGEVKLFGKPVEDAKIRLRLGYLPEGPYFYEHLNIYELLRYYGNLHNLDARTIRERSAELIERVGLSHASSRPIKSYSKGMRQRAGLAQALINNPDLIILDEPQSGLDPIGRKEVRDLIFQLKEQGKTIIFSSHILPDVEAVCDRIALFAQGRVVQQGALHEIMDRRTTSIEVLVTQIDKSDCVTLPSLKRLDERATSLYLYFSPEQDLMDVLSKLKALGGQIKSVTPVREALEEVFMKSGLPNTQTINTAEEE